MISVKSSSVRETIEAYEYLSGKCDYPLHLGVTESGSALRGAVKSSVGIGALLLKGIGDTIRVSLTGDPREEVKVAKLILGSLGLKNCGAEIVSCPTCSRCEYDAESVVRALEEATAKITKPIKIAVMGCAVNGPGEAKKRRRCGLRRKKRKNRDIRTRRFLKNDRSERSRFRNARAYRKIVRRDTGGRNSIEIQRNNERRILVSRT